MCAPRWRSASRPNSAAVRIGKASSTSTTVTRMFHVKIGIRNIVMPGRAHAHDRRDEVDAAEDGAEAGDGEADDPEVGAVARGVERVRQRRVGEPAEAGGAARDEEPGHDHRAAEEEQPVGEGVEPRERHVGRPDLQRHDVVREAEQDRRRVQQQHDRAVHGEQLVVLLDREDLQARPGELGAHQQRHQSADQEEAERRDQVEDPEVLGVGRLQHPTDERAGLRLPRRIRRGRDRLRCDGRHGCLLPTAASSGCTPDRGTALVDPAIVTARGPRGSPGERIHDNPS